MGNKRGGALPGPLPVQPRVLVPGLCPRPTCFGQEPVLCLQAAPSTWPLDSDWAAAQVSSPEFLTVAPTLPTPLHSRP